MISNIIQRIQCYERDDVRVILNDQLFNITNDIEYQITVSYRLETHRVEPNGTCSLNQ